MAEVDAAWRARFETDAIDWKDASYIPPAISHLQWTDVMSQGKYQLLAMDMRDGSVNLLDVAPGKTTRSVIARLGNPARATVADIDADSHNDLLVGRAWKL